MTISDLNCRILNDTKGAAMAEGVIVMPLFIVVLAGVIHLHRSYGAKLDASVEARECAWAYSVAGCVESTQLPKRCNVQGLSGRKQGLEDIGSAVGFSVPTNQNGDAGAESGALAKTSDVARTLVGLRDAITARPSRAVMAPSILGGRKRQISADYTVMCNERDMTPTEIAKYAYCSFGDLPGCE